MILCTYAAGALMIAGMAPALYLACRGSAPQRPLILQLAGVVTVMVLPALASAA